MAMSFMWLLLTVTVTCMCASPRCRSSAAKSMSFSDYCQRLCVWGRGGNLCHCNRAHFVGKRSDVRQSDLTDRSLPRKQLVRQEDVDDDNDNDLIWNVDGDNEEVSDAVRAPDEWFNEENLTSPDDDVKTEQSPDTGSSGSHQPLILFALRRLGRRGGAMGVGNSIQLLRDGAKKGEESYKRGAVEQSGLNERSTDDRDGLVTLNALTRRPTTFRLSPTTHRWNVLRKITSQPRRRPSNNVFYRLQQND